MIGICTDSNAQLPRELAARLGIEVVALTVSIDGVDYAEGVDLDADAFYDRFAGGARPRVATAAPSPARFVEAYRRLAARGATAVVSVHIGAELSGTLNAAHAAAPDAPVPVRLVDTGSASFVVALATWAAVDAAAAGASLDDAASEAERVAASCGNVFVVGTLELARAGGRLAPVSEDHPRGVPVLRLAHGKIEPVGEAATPEEAVTAMADAVLSGGRRLRVGVGTSDGSSRPVADTLASRLAGAPGVVEVVRYRVGPSVGAHTGPGTAGAVYHSLG
jgi:DegV family protein with EDD domain